MAVRHATRQRVRGVVSLVTVLAMYVAVGLAPFLLPAVTAIDPMTAMRTTVLVVAAAHCLLVLALIR